MARKVPAATDWRPLDIFEEGPSISRKIPKRRVWDQLDKLLPNRGTRDPDALLGAWGVLSTAFVLFVKARKDHAGYPRAATVRGHLETLAGSLDAVIEAFNALDIRTLDLLYRAAGTRQLAPADYNSIPLNESPIPGGPATKGHHRLRLFRQALKDARQWVKEADQQRPKRDTRAPDEPGLLSFVSDMAHVWETYGGERFTASRNKGGAPDFIHAILQVAGFNVSLAKVLTAAQTTVTRLEAEQPDRIIVRPEDHSKSLLELARAPRRRKRP